MLKKLSGIVFLLSSSTSIALANVAENNMNSPSGVVLIAPSTPGMWTIGLEALMMMPVDKFQFSQAVLAQTDGSILLHNESVDNQKDFGWSVNAGYQFANTGRDIAVSFTDVNSGDNESYSVQPGTPLYGPNGRNNALEITDGGQADSNAFYHYRAVNLTMGQLFNIGQRVTLHPFMGVQYANTNLDGKTDYIDTSGEENNFISDSIFSGAGPRAGLDASIHLCWGFSIVGTIGSSILVGSLSDPYKIVANAGVDDATITTTYNNGDNIEVVPELDGSFGLDYQYAFNPTTIFDAQFGVQMMDYFNADQHDFISTAEVNSTLAEEDFGLHGLYLRTQFSFA